MQVWQSQHQFIYLLMMQALQIWQSYQFIYLLMMQAWDNHSIVFIASIHIFLPFFKCFILSDRFHVSMPFHLCQMKTCINVQDRKMNFIIKPSITKIIMYNFTISCIKSSNHSIKTFNSFITTSSKVLLNIILNDSYRYLKFLQFYFI